MFPVVLLDSGMIALILLSLCAFSKHSSKVLQGIVSINMIHVAQWSCTEALFRESGKLLNKGQFLILYGPFKICNKHTSESNYLFDNSLKMQNDLWGIKNLEEVCDESKKNGFYQEDIIRMPANNFSIIYKKVS